MLRVAAYCRVSTDKEDQVNSFEGQQRYFREWIRRNPDWVLYNIYADEGISGTSTKKRRQFHAMIAAARAGEIDLIITKEVSRFARNTLDTLEYTRELQRYGVGVFFLIDNIDTRQQEGELRLTLMSSMAQEESRKTSQRVKWGQTRRMEQGVVFGGSLLGYDVSEGRLTVNPAGAKIVRRIFYQYLHEHKGSTRIARELQAEGVPSSRGNVNWSAATVLKILKNEKYCGDLIQKKTYTPDYLTHEKRYNRGQEPLVVLRNHHEAIISRESWEAVQRELKRRSRGGTPCGQGHGSRYPLSGKIKCGACGSSFSARKKRDGSGASYLVWRCGRAAARGTDAGRDGCQIGRQLRNEAAMEMIRQAVQRVALDRETLFQRLMDIVEAVLQEEGAAAHAQARRLEKELAANQGKMRQLLADYWKGDLSKEDYQRLQEYGKARENELKQQLAAHLAQKDEADPQQGIAAAIRALLSGGGDEAFYGRLLECMSVYLDGRVEVKLRFLPARWVFYQVHNKASVPISVSSPLSSGYGMA